MSRWLCPRVFVLALVLLVVLGQPVLAQGGRGGEVLFGRDFTLRGGERLYGDVVVFGGDATLEAGSALRGNLLTLGGTVHIAGDVDGDVFALGGDVRLSETAVVAGDVAASGAVVREPGARVSGQVMSGFRRGVRAPVLHVWRGPSICLPGWGLAWPWSIDLGNFVARFAQAIFGALGVLALGVLAVLLIPGPTRVVGESVVQYPAQSIGVGLLTLLVAVLAVPLLVITCLGIPAAVVVGLAVAIGVLFGWIAAGLILGDRLLAALNQAERQPVPAVAIGLLVLAVLSGVPCLGVLVSLLVGTWGLGAVVLTRFGTSPYLPMPPQVTPAPAPPVPPSAEPPQSGGSTEPPLDPSNP